MLIKYQLVTIGNTSPFRDGLIESLFGHLDELGINSGCLEVLNDDNYVGRHTNNAPTVGLYFGGQDLLHVDVLEDLIHGAAYVIPIVSDLDKFSDQIPKVAGKINGFQLASKTDIEPLTSAVLEGFSLLRNSRRLFISYKRADTSTIAIQLYEALERAGFDVFLDTHSVRPGDQFQDELWHRMADTDVVIVLNSKHFNESFWTTQELAEASGMSIAMLQLIWPDVKQLPNSDLTILHQLVNTDFDNSFADDVSAKLSDPFVSELVSMVEGVRARALAARQDKLTTEFKRAADEKKIPVELQPQKYFSLTKGRDTKIVIPTVGVPQAFTYNQYDEKVKGLVKDTGVDVFLLYDHKNIRDRWLSHLSWLDSHLPIKSFRITDAETWLTNNL